MVFTKSFPRTNGRFTEWKEVSLTEKEDRETEKKAEVENFDLLKKCLDKAKRIMDEKGLKYYQTDLVNLAIALYRNIASHTVYHKEAIAREKLNNK